MNSIPLGDKHNFGKQVVYLGDGWIHKPRNIFWEWLLLAANSPFRPYLTQKIPGASPASILPKLQFKIDPKGFLHGGSVEKLEVLPPNPALLSEERFEEIGAVIGLLMFLGMTDLHNENFVLGVDSRGEVVFGPLDIEVALEDIYLPSQAQLLPSKDVAWSDAGLHKLKFYLEEFAGAEALPALLHGYLNTVKTLLAVEDELHQFINSLAPLSGMSSRLVVRPTRHYYSFLKNSRPASELSSSEAEQLSRSEIPYFFRSLSDLTIRQFCSPVGTEEAEVHEEQRSRVLHHARLWQDGKLSPRKNQDLLLKAGPLQLLKYLTDHNSLFQSSYLSTAVERNAQEINLAFAPLDLHLRYELGGS
jgi:hypothetical protein